MDEINGDLYWNGDQNDVTATETTSVTGWTVAKLANPRYANIINGAVQTTFQTSPTLPNTTDPAVDASTATLLPYTPPDLLLENGSIMTLYPYTGYFPAGNWTFNFPVIAAGTGGAQDGRIRMEVFKATRSGNAFGTVTRLTTTNLLGATVLNITTTTSLNSSITWSAPAFFLNNEFLICKIAWEITGAGGANNAGVRMRFGRGVTMTSTNFRDRAYNIN